MGLMATSLEVRYVDGSRDVVRADFHERVGDEEHFVTFAGPGGGEKVVRLKADRIAAIEPVSAP